MGFVDVFIVILTLAIFSLEVVSMRKASQKAYASPYVTMFRGLKVAALLKEKEVKDERIKKILIINSVVKIFLLLVLITLFFSRRFTGDYELVISFTAIGTSFLAQWLVDWRIKKIVKQAELTG
ncbi:hypothetical protein AKA01nite_15920 [Alkalibacterium kapii]|uniref:Uncharacterized protein n=2 Tax=Alkalibacterium kapii TaxID=426704 RepID=A0A511AUU4_9LACT|nr:hypothetical protein AKA01nite_15920 [Alkalibacterium kapii]